MSAKERYERLAARFKNASAKTAEAAKSVRTSAEVIGMAGILGAVRGDYEGNGKTFEIGADAAKGKAGIAPELVLGLPLKVAGLYLGSKDGGSDVNALADGALAAWANQAARAAMFKRAQGSAKSGAAGPKHLQAARERLAEARQRAAAQVR